MKISSTKSKWAVNTIHGSENVILSWVKACFIILHYSKACALLRQALGTFLCSTYFGRHSLLWYLIGDINLSVYLFFFIKPSQLFLNSFNFFPSEKWNWICVIKNTVLFQAERLCRSGSWLFCGKLTILEMEFSR